MNVKYFHWSSERGANQVCVTITSYIGRMLYYILKPHICGWRFVEVQVDWMLRFMANISRLAPLTVIGSATFHTYWYANNLRCNKDFASQRCYCKMSVVQFGCVNKWTYLDVHIILTK